MAANVAGQREQLRRLSLALKPFLKLNERMPVRSVQALLTVATYPGKSMTWYSKQCDMKLSTMSRALLDLSERNRHKGDGFGLVERRGNEENLRENAYTLTPAGDRFLNKILGQIE